MRAVEVVTRLRDEQRVYARPLGDVVYLMVTPTTSKQQCDGLLMALISVLDGCSQVGPARVEPDSDGCVV
jgi:adenosylmethionine-8-amino-7-oxononanoate aminotransferase